MLTSFGHELISMLTSFSVVRNRKSSACAGIASSWLNKLNWLNTRVSNRGQNRLMALRSCRLIWAGLLTSKFSIVSELIFEPQIVRKSSRPINLQNLKFYALNNLYYFSQYLLWLKTRVTWSRHLVAITPAARVRFSVSVTLMRKFLSFGHVWITLLSFSSVPV